GLLPLLGGCCAAYLIACVMAKHSIMTEKIARRGRPVPTDYVADYLSQVLVRDIGAKAVVTLSASQTIAEVRGWLAEDGALLHHHGFPVLDGETLVGVVTQRELLAPSLQAETTVAVIVSRAPVVIGVDATARAAADLMVREAVGRLPVLERGRLVGIVTRSDLLEAHSDRLASEQQARRFRRIGLRGARA
ncbi:MAG TPA: CBS domain-containing protein, partial [Polyangium sp.]|nr:CBS domain-containing protein [Polyangium sp.]